MDVQAKIKEMLTANDVVLFMKGSPQMPQCGFSGAAAQMLAACDAEFLAVDVLKDMEIREGIKKHANWPTIPQLYIKGEFIGGADIMRNMYQSGELKTLLTDA